MPIPPDSDPTDSTQDGFSLLQHGHKDMVQATAFNAYGDRFASSSVDGKIKVYNRHKDGNWVLCDTWGAHTAEILQVNPMAPPTIHPHLIASIGTDGRFKLWVEDPTLPPSKGRRFNSHSNKPIYELRSPSRAPYLSFAITHNATTRHTYLALIDRNAILTVYENDEPENLESWNDLDRVNVCERPKRGEEVSFKVAFDPNLEPCYMGIRQGVPRDSLGIVVASMNRASIWRTKEISHSVSLGGSGTTKEFYLAAELKGHKGLVRDVAWAPGNIRGFDIVATACKDGFVRVFQVTTPGKGGARGVGGASSLRSKDFSKVPDKVIVQQQRNSAENGSTSRVAPSGIGAGLQYTRPRNPDSQQQQQQQVREGEVLHVAKEVSRLEANRNPVWRVEFDADGQLLGSTGDDGKLMLWRREPSGSWSKSSELAMTRTVVA
ncbi:WD40-repeat-containing domain protein [Rhexocercosporidium sp. MPI-PUGE-AT-0058]|nr:WD40-repeat-containing domain protein [Rhexocercosporidium sp. MPI-PUGE-AT-0058]